MKRVQIAGRSGRAYFDGMGNMMYTIGDYAPNIGDWVVTDGRYIYGHTATGGAPVIVATEEYAPLVSNIFDDDLQQFIFYKISKKAVCSSVGGFGQNMPIASANSSNAMYVAIYQLDHQIMFNLSTGAILYNPDDLPGKICDIEIDNDGNLITVVGNADYTEFSIYKNSEIIDKIECAEMAAESLTKATELAAEYGSKKKSTSSASFEEGLQVRSDYGYFTCGISGAEVIASRKIKLDGTEYDIDVLVQQSQYFTKIDGKYDCKMEGISAEIDTEYVDGGLSTNSEIKVIDGYCGKAKCILYPIRVSSTKYRQYYVLLAVVDPSSVLYPYRRAINNAYDTNDCTSRIYQDGSGNGNYQMRIQLDDNFSFSVAHGLWNDYTFYFDGKAIVNLGSDFQAVFPGGIYACKLGSDSYIIGAKDYGAYAIANGKCEKISKYWMPYANYRCRMSTKIKKWYQKLLEISTS